MDTKQVIIIRKDLNMRKGKIAAQAAHASMAVILDLIDKGHITNHSIAGWHSVYESHAPVVNWLKGRFTKICVSVNTEEELISLYTEAENLDIPCSIITDAGLTEFKGVPTRTAVAIGPWYSEDIDKLTGTLKLL